MNVRRVLEFLLGVYAASVLVPVGVLLGSDPATATSDLGALVGTGVVVAALVALLARTITNPPERLATLPVAAATTLPPLAYFPYMVLSTAPESAAAAVSMVGLLGVLPGIAVPVGGAIARNRRLRATATEVVVVTVGDDEDDDTDRRLVAATVLVGAGLLVAGGFTLLADGGTGTTLITTIGGLSTMVTLLAGDDATEVAVTDRGLRFDRSFTRWDRMAGYRVGDDAVELVREAWYVTARAFDREEIDDEHALLDGLAEYLPRLDDEGDIQQGPRRRHSTGTRSR